MQHPQIILYEGDEFLHRQLEEEAKQRRWSLRQASRPAGCLSLLAKNQPTVVVLKVGRDLSTEFGILERIHFLHPEIPTVVTIDRQDSSLISLAWDLGASYVLVSPQDRSHLPGIVVGLMTGGGGEESGVRSQGSSDQ